MKLEPCGCIIDDQRNILALCQTHQMLLGMMNRTGEETAEIQKKSEGR